MLIKIIKGIITISVILLASVGVFASNSSIKSYIDNFSSSESEIGKLINGFFDNEGYIDVEFIKNNSLSGTKIIDNSIGEDQIVDDFIAKDSKKLNGEDSDEYQKKLKTQCSGGDAIQKIEQDGTVTCVDTGTGDDDSSNSLWSENSDDIYYNDGKVGIGTDSPRTKLDVSTNDAGLPAILAGNDINDGVTAGYSSIAMGNNAKSEGSHSISLGYNTSSEGAYSIAMGNESKSEGDYGFSIGYQSNASEPYSIAMGNESKANGDYSLTIGYQTSSNDDYAISLGNNSEANGTYSIAMGNDSESNGDYSLTIGYQTSSNDDYAISLGNNSEANGTYSIAMGNETISEGVYSIASGYKTKAYEQYSIAMGSESEANGAYSMAMGNTTKASNNYSIAMGSNTISSEQYSIVMGSESEANGAYSMASGYKVNTDENYSFIFGKNGKVGNNDIFALAYGDDGDENETGSGLIFRVEKSGEVYADGSFHSSGADYAEYFETEHLDELNIGDIVGFNNQNGKVRKYQVGDEFIGIVSDNPSILGNTPKGNKKEKKEWTNTHVIVGLLGQLNFNKKQVNIKGKLVYTKDNKKIGLLLNTGKILIK